MFPVDRLPIEHGAVTIEDGRIVAVGAKAEADDVTDLGSVALLPGLVNAHTHLEFNYLRQPLGESGMRLADWIRLVIAERGRGDTSPLVSYFTGLNQSLRHGVTALCDIATSDVQQCFDSFESIDVAALAEVIGFSPARAASILSATIERLDRVQQWDGGFSDTFGRGFRQGISPHAPYTVSPFLLQQLVELARIRSLPMAMHLAESVDELELLRAGTGPFVELLEERSMWDAAAIPRGSRPLDYLRMLAEAPRALVIHGNYLDGEERAFLAANADRMSLVYCPRTHAYFQHPPYPLAELLRAGVRVALGTDSRASNPDLDLLAEMRYVAETHANIDPSAILRAGTLAGAEALGRPRDMGSITPGKLANFVAVPLPDGVGRFDEVLSDIFAGRDAPSAVWVRGQRIEIPQQR